MPKVNWKAVQRRLLELGFDPGPLDGLRGPKSEGALADFKNSLGLAQKPLLEPITYRALFYQSSGNDPALPWMKMACQVKGLHEERNLHPLKKWLSAAVARIDPRSIPWCGAFVASCLRHWRAEIPLPDNPLTARNWLNFGEDCRPQVGAVLVFWRGKRRGWRGHVGFYCGEDATHFHVLGGNQSDAVTIARIAKNRLLGARWPIGYRQSGVRRPASPTNLSITTNEA